MIKQIDSAQSNRTQCCFADHGYATHKELEGRNAPCTGLCKRRSVISSVVIEKG